VAGLDGLASLASGGELGLTARSSRAWGASLGWRPFQRTGLWVSGELRGLSLDARAPLGWTAVDREGASVPVTLDLALDLQLAGGALGWDWVIGHLFVLRLSGGMLRVVGGSSELVTNTEAPVSTGAEQLDRTLDGLLERGLLLPYVGLGAGMRFGQRG
jgi:hypothetical protein